MTYVVSTINLKGGVGKTTTTVALAEFLSGELSKRVLVVDLDPQTNATIMLIGEPRWAELNSAGRTLATLFRDGLRGYGEAARFDLAATLQRGVSPVAAVRTVDLLPSSLELIDVQDRLVNARRGQFLETTPVDLLHRAVRPILSNYDYVLVDCPPNLGIVTLNGLRVSRGYVIPTIPDVLSSYGIPQIQTRVRNFAEAIGKEIAELGIVVTKFRKQAKVHLTTLADLHRDKASPPLFASVIPEAGEIAGAAEHNPAPNLNRKYHRFSSNYSALAREFVERCEARL